MPRHIVQVSAYYPPHLGGQEHVVSDLAQQLAGAGHHVQVLTSSLGGGPHGDQREGRALVKRLGGFVFGHAPIMPGLLLALWRLPPQAVVHLHIGQAFTPEIVWLISKLRRFKYIAELHIDFKPSGPAGVLLPLYKKLVLKPVLRSAAAVITLNEPTLQLVRNQYGCPSSKTYILPNGIDDAYFGLPRPAFEATPPQILRLLFVGRLEPQKNLLTLLKALTLTKRRVQLEVGGQGSQLAAIRQAVQTLGLNNVTLHGRLDRQAVMRFYQTCDALIMPSSYEAQPLVLLEAMAARIPVIGTSVIGVAEHIKNAGIVVPPTAQGLAKGIERYYAQYDQLPKLVAQGYKQAQRVRWRNVLKQYEALYETAT